MNKIWTILDVLNWTTNFFKEKNIENPRLDAEIIIASVLKIKRLDVYIKFEQILNDSERKEIHNLIKRRAQREPLQYILGETDFYNCKLKLNNSVLIPRPETEYLIDKILNDSYKPKKILDLCTGSGAIAISLKKAIPDSTITASDISEKALELAKKNAIENDVKVNFIHSDIFDNIEGKFDLIVSNPPYVDEKIYSDLEPEIFFEPKLALVAEDKGLAIYKKILEKAEEFLNNKGIIYFEMGDEQSFMIKEYATKMGFGNIEIIKDLAGKERFMRMEKIL